MLNVWGGFLRDLSCAWHLSGNGKEVSGYLGRLGSNMLCVLDRDLRRYESQLPLDTQTGSGSYQLVIEELRKLRGADAPP